MKLFKKTMIGENSGINSICSISNGIKLEKLSKTRKKLIKLIHVLKNLNKKKPTNKRSSKSNNNKRNF